MPNHVHLVVRSELRKPLATDAAAEHRPRPLVQPSLESPWLSCSRGASARGSSTSDADLMGLVRYVNGNPLEGGLVASLDALARFPWSGHGSLVGTREARCPSRRSWRRSRFSMPTRPGRASACSSGWPRLARRVRPRDCPLRQGRRRTLQAQPAFPLYTSDGLGLEGLVAAICAHYRLTPEQLRSRRRQPEITRARAVLAYWGVVQLGLMCRSLAPVLGITPAAVSASLERGRRFALEDGFEAGHRGPSV